MYAVWYMAGRYISKSMIGWNIFLQGFQDFGNSYFSFNLLVKHGANFQPDLKNCLDMNKVEVK